MSPTQGPVYNKMQIIPNPENKTLRVWIQGKLWATFCDE
jgi:hypothetical protein